MQTEAQKKAKIKYREKMKRFTIEFCPTEYDLIEQIKKQPNKQGYIKDFIRTDMERDPKEP